MHSLFSFYSVSFLVREFFLKGWQWSFYSLWLYQVRNFIFPYIFCTTETKQIGICNGPQFALGAWYYFVNKRWSWPFFPDKSWFVLIYIYCCRYTIMHVSKILFCKKMFRKTLLIQLKIRPKCELKLENLILTLKNRFRGAMYWFRSMTFSLVL